MGCGSGKQARMVVDSIEPKLSQQKENVTITEPTTENKEKEKPKPVEQQVVLEEVKKAQITEEKKLDAVSDVKVEQKEEKIAKVQPNESINIPKTTETPHTEIKSQEKQEDNKKEPKVENASVKHDDKMKSENQELPRLNLWVCN